MSDQNRTKELKMSEIYLTVQIRVESDANVAELDIRDILDILHNLRRQDIDDYFDSSDKCVIGFEAHEGDIAFHTV